MLVPLYGFLQGDSLGLIVLVQDSEPVKRIAEVLSQAASMRVPPMAAMDVFAAGKRLDPEATVAQAGLTALDRVDVAAI
jgi:hypothetical protein